MPGNEYADGMWEMDQNVGKLLKTLDDLAIAEQHHRHLHHRQRPELASAGRTPRPRHSASEKDTNWEGAFRVPAMIRWPGKIKAG